MPRVNYQDLVDIDGMRAALAQTRDDYDAFIQHSKRLNAELLASQKANTDELLRLRASLGGAALSEQAKRVAGLNQQLDHQRTATAALATTGRTLDAVQQSITSRTEDLLRRYTELTGTSARVVAEKKRVIKELVTLQGELDRAGKLTSATAKATGQLSGDYNRLQRELTEARKTFRSMDGALDTNTGRINKANRAAVDLADKIQRLDTILKRADSQIGIHTRNVGNYGGALGSAGGKVLGFAQNMAVGALGLMGLDSALSTVQKGLQVIADFERYEASLRAVSDGAEDFARTEQYLIRMADELGISYELLIERYKMLKAATRDTALEGAMTEKMFLSLMRASVALGISQDGLRSILRALEQMISKGSIQAEELRQQLGDHLPGAMKLFAVALGKSERELNKMMKAGDVLAATTLPQMAENLEKVYGADAEKNINRMTGSFERLKTNVALAVDAFNDNGKVSGFFAAINNGLSDVAADLRVLIQSDDWQTFFRYLTGDPVAWAKAGKMRRTQQDFTARLDDFGRLDAPGREKALIKQTERLQKLQADYDRVLAQPATDTSLAREKALERQMEREGQLWVEMRKLGKKRLVEEKENALRLQTLQGEIALEKEEKEAKKRERQRNKAERERKAEEARQRQAMQDEVRRAKDGTDRELSQLEVNRQAGKISEVQFIAERLRIRTEGAAAEQQVLERYKAKESEEYRAADRAMLDAQAEYLKARNSLQEGAFKDALSAARDAVAAISQTEGSALDSGLASLEAAFKKEQAAIQQNVTRHQISEEQGYEQLQALKTRYLSDVLTLTLGAIDRELAAEMARFDSLEALAQTEEQRAEIRRQKEEAERNAAVARQKARDKDLTDHAGAAAETRTKKEEMEARKREAIERLTVDNVLQAAQAYLDITSGFRQAELSALERQKDYELRLAGDNDAAKEQIEKRFAQRQKEIRRRQAVAERAAALFQIAVNTAANAVKVSALGPLAIALTITLGAIQAAAVVATPIPEFFKGKRDDYEGPAWVGERGFEFIERKDPSTGKRHTEVAAQKALTYIGQHDRVYTHAESKAMLNSNATLAAEVRKNSPATVTQPYGPAQPTGPAFTPDQMKQAMKEALAELPIEQHHWNDKGYQRYTEQQGQRTRSLNDMFQLPRKPR